MISDLAPSVRAGVWDSRIGSLRLRVGDGVAGTEYTQDQQVEINKRRQYDKTKADFPDKLQSVLKAVDRVAGVVGSVVHGVPFSRRCRPPARYQSRSLTGGRAQPWPFSTVSILRFGKRISRNGLAWKSGFYLTYAGRRSPPVTRFCRHRIPDHGRNCAACSAAQSRKDRAGAPVISETVEVRNAG